MPYDGSMIIGVVGTWVGADATAAATAEEQVFEEVEGFYAMLSTYEIIDTTLAESLDIFDITK